LHDNATRDLAFDAMRRYPGGRVALYATDVFYANGAWFNKGAAMEEARGSMPWEDWILFLDADVVPEADWKEKVDAAGLQSGKLYGCRRLNARDQTWIDNPLCAAIADDRVGYGYFQLFHSADPLVQKRPLLERHWVHGGNYDSMFLLRWPRAEELNLRLWHIGGPSHNWYGKGQDHLFDAMERERIRRGGGWASIDGERLPAG